MYECMSPLSGCFNITCVHVICTCRYLEDDNSVRVYMNVFLMQLATACTAVESSVRLRELYNEFLNMFVTLLLDEVHGH